MNLKEFNILEEKKQYEEIWNGDFVGHRIEGTFTVVMYKVHSFYVEVYYQRDSNFIKGFRRHAYLKVILKVNLLLNVVKKIGLRFHAWNVEQ